MKKAIISLGAILFSGVLLASCSSTKTLSRPSKGKAVNSVSFKTADGDVEINKNDKYEDVIKKVGTNHIYKKDNSFGVEIVNYYKSIEKSQNYIVPLQLEYGDSYSENEQGVFDSRTFKDYNNTYIDAYTKYENEKTTSYYAETKKISQDNYVGNYSTTIIRGWAGTTIDSKDNYSVDAGKYEIRKTKSKNNESALYGRDGEEYQYLDKTEKKSDSNFNAIHEGKDDNGNLYSYTITRFCHHQEDCQIFQYDSELSSIFFDGEYEDLYKASFELTNKYIILKIKYDFSIDTWCYAGDENFTDAQMVKKIKELQRKEFKGSYSQYEIWISYDMKSETDSSVVVPSCVYCSCKEVSKYNTKDDITKELLERNNIDIEKYGSYIGKKYIRKGSRERIYQAKYNNKNYESKINKLKDECKKNNIFDKIDMTIVGV